MPDLMPDPTEGRHGGNPESAAAFASVPDRRVQLARVVAYIRERGALGATCDQTEQALDMSHQTCSARFTEARRDGLITATIRRRATRTGRNARVYVAV